MLSAHTTRLLLVLQILSSVPLHMLHLFSKMLSLPTLPLHLLFLHTLQVPLVCNLPQEGLPQSGFISKGMTVSDRVLSAIASKSSHVLNLKGGRRAQTSLLMHISNYLYNNHI